MDVRFHCSKRVRQSGKRAKHQVFGACETVCKVLRLNCGHGVSIPKFHALRKMRVRVPGLNVGKSGGYRLIYRMQQMDEAMHVVFLETYFKGDCEDLTHDEYKLLLAESEAIMARPLLFDWE
jgi:hypothetical protein